MTKRRVVLLAKNIHRVTDQQNAVTAMNNWKFRGEIEIRASLFLTLIRQKDSKPDNAVWRAWNYDDKQSGNISR